MVTQVAMLLEEIKAEVEDCYEKDAR